MSFKVGDRVSILQESGYLTVIEIKSTHLIVVEDDDGFERIVPINTLVPLMSSDFGVIPDFSKDELELQHQRSKKQKQPIKKSNWNGFPYIDLHIEELVANHQELPVQEILQIQMSRFRSFIRKCIERNEKKCYIIHGVGEGVLRSEVHLYLHRMDAVTYDFANSIEFGELGATEVRFL